MLTAGGSNPRRDGYMDRCSGPIVEIDTFLPSEGAKELFGHDFGVHPCLTSP